MTQIIEGLKSGLLEIALSGVLSFTAIHFAMDRPKNVRNGTIMVLSWVVGCALFVAGAVVYARLNTDPWLECTGEIIFVWGAFLAVSAEILGGILDANNTVVPPAPPTGVDLKI